MNTQPSVSSPALRRPETAERLRAAPESRGPDEADSVQSLDPRPCARRCRRSMAAARSVRWSLRCAVLRQRPRPDHLRSLRRGADRGAAGRGDARVARLRQSHGAGVPGAGRDGARPRLGRRHRRPPLGAPRRPDRQGLRSRHDRRHAGAGAREPAQGRASRTSSSSKGEIEAIPLPGRLGRRDHLQLRDQSLGRQGAVLAEAFRVLRPGGRFAVSDVVVRGEMPEAVRRSVELWIGCVAGALRGGGVRATARRGGFRGDRDRADADLSRRGRPRVSRWNSRREQEWTWKAFQRTWTAQ